ncbi:MAG: Light-independent protochlorophyllide reductase subunit B [Methanosaeta sp. PtaB.Bin039]|nr:MAG: Light-independent protochlorophyllide reductase subunit B [Methanosaeta sp. PtaB.Bin039]OPY44629.1 MAG: Light-independent protochlorophyllide reductase subunit B [Methanosaeta sp. PtaU1.Bin028]HOT06382.1 Ni-sirohydrochlorin a,c-diamide reductive cyclase catalytic subunit [Methanotrichaceae archaeon]HQF16153.1 Ni-sirohydrochlorin a,c-diamide reductive cyclase catalytic subunit [Methanotrichaceae archaeon]HQI90889.1 Ni-sirohydrochlorin a,c-diamide reductive cyclase catalytic subunit [Meth
MSTQIENLQVIHPRPSSIVAALYTLRDLGADVVILHGPSGCCFKHARLLEEDGVHVLTTALDEKGFVFGGQEQLVRLLKRSAQLFSPRLIAVAGTCSSMIIGEDLHQAVLAADLDVPVMEAEVHAGYRDNTQGVIIALEGALEIGLIDQAEFERQKRLLSQATEVEKRFGAASSEYLAPERGEIKYTFASRILDLIEEGKRGLNILNAKKETAYMFADINAAVVDAARSLGRGDCIDTFANLNDQAGLAKVRRDAKNIAAGLRERGIDFLITGALDEYPVAGQALADMIKGNSYDFAVITGVPHALPIDMLKGLELFSVTNGPRQVKPLREIGHQHVTVEIDLHPKTMGVTSIVESELGATLRQLADDRKA